MRPRMMIFSVLWIGGTVWAEEPAAPAPVTPPPPEARAQVEARLDADAKSFGVTRGEMKRLREYGYSDSELRTQLVENKRTARQLITEREVVDDLAKALVEVNKRVYNMPPDQQDEEREKGMRDAVNRIRWTRRASREEIRQILTKTSFLRDDEVSRVAR